MSSVTNFELNENSNANIKQANAKVYFIGPQYETAIPVEPINIISTNLSITM